MPAFLQKVFFQDTLSWQCMVNLESKLANEVDRVGIILKDRADESGPPISISDV